MLIIIRLFYQLGLFFYRIAIAMASLGGNKKATRFRAGRKQLFERLEIDLKDNSAPIFWMHCASLGEFEQGRPLLEALRIQYPTHKMLLSFFSPSGYEQCKEYKGADWVYYLPLDNNKNAQKWLDIIQPQKVFFVKYEYWYYYLTAMQNRKIEVYLVAAIFRPQQAFFKWYGAFFRKMLACFTQIFVQDAVSQQLLQSIDIRTSHIIGDTRLDRVLQIKKEVTAIPIIQHFCGNKPTLVAGSTWKQDEEILAQFLEKNNHYQLIIAPHEIHEKHLLEIEERMMIFGCVRYTNCDTENDLETKRVLILDTMGMLSQVYQYAKVAHIGGGFGAGIHNTLEAVVYQIPIIFGHNYQKFKEAKDLLQLGVAHEIKNAADLYQFIKKVEEKPNQYLEIQQKAKLYLHQNQGATQKIIDKIA